LNVNRLGSGVFIEHDSLYGGVRASLNLRHTPMSKHERERLCALCARIVDEKNRDVFLQLVFELNDLLEKMDTHDARHTDFNGENAIN
jgi:hypothetical protein